MESIGTFDQLIVIVDVVIVAYLFYMLIRFSKKTNTVNVLKGIAFVLLIKVLSDFLKLYTVSWIIDQVITWGVIALIIIFQPEIRRSLDRLGQSRWLRKRDTRVSHSRHMIEHLVDAVKYLSKRNIGALICIELENSLNTYAQSGVKMDAHLTSQLLINVFIPNTPLHDGAVVVKQGRIEAAGCVLPLSEDETIPQELGTRHRAAVGLSEKTDALVIVISEETGDVSISHQHTLHRKLKLIDAQTILEKYLLRQDEHVSSFKDKVLSFFQGEERR